MTNKNIICFLYLLGRDCLPLGEISNLVKQIETSDELGRDYVYTNKHLLQYSLEVLERLKT